MESGLMGAFLSPIFVIPEFLQCIPGLHISLIQYGILLIRKHMCRTAPKSGVMAWVVAFLDNFRMNTGMVDMSPLIIAMVALLCFNDELPCV
jgi:hypothetical protein